MSADVAARKGIPDASVARLPGYLRALSTFATAGTASISSEELATAAGVSPAMLRKDLSHLGSYGVRGVGYEVDTLAFEISGALGLTRNWPVAIIGMGNLGRALAAYGGFASRGFDVIALLDRDDAIIGSTIGDLVVRPTSNLEELVREHGLAIGVITTPAAAAQQVADELVSAGIRSILNFAPRRLDVPHEVMTRTVDMSTELQILAFHEQRRTGDLAALGLDNEVAI